MEKVIIVGFEPFQYYFRKGMFQFARQHNLDMTYIQITKRRCYISCYDVDKFDTHEVNFLELLKYRGADLMLFNLGMTNFINIMVLKCVLSPRRMYWDYIDNLYYGKETLGKLINHKLYEWLSDGVLVLNNLLSYRFKNPIEFGNASHLKKLKHTPDPNTIITLSSIDSRFDFELYERLLQSLPQKQFKLYGWIKDNDQQINQRLHSWREYTNFEYGGEYHNDQLQEILTGAGIGLIPYKVSEMTLHINPDKYYHYSNAGLNIVSSYIPAIVNKPNLYLYTQLEDLVIRLDQDFVGSDTLHYSWEENVIVLRKLVSDSPNR